MKLKEAISITQSGSGINGKRLREAHHRIGYQVGMEIKSEQKIDVVLGLLRSGVFFAEGIADAFDCTLILLDPQNSAVTESVRKELENKTVVIADGVINTGKEILEIRDRIREFTARTILAGCVVQSDLIRTLELYAGRVSENKYCGSDTTIVINGKGPDTGDRLFKTKIQAD